MICGISNSVSSHEIANTCTSTIENRNHNSMHSEFPTNHLNKTPHIFKPETGMRSLSGYSWIPNEKFGIRPQSLGLYQSNVMLHDQRCLTPNITALDPSNQPIMQSLDSSSKKEDFNSKMYFKKRNASFDDQNKNATIPTSLMSPNIIYNGNGTFKGGKLKTNLPHFQSSHLKKNESRTSYRGSIRERSPGKLFSAKETHLLNYNATGNVRESYKYAAAVNKCKEKSRATLDEATKLSQTRSASTPSRKLPEDDVKNSKNTDLQNYHEPQLRGFQTGLHEVNELMKKDVDDNKMESLSKANFISPSIISHKTEHLNNSSLLVKADRNTPIQSTNNSLALNTSTNCNVTRWCDMTDPAAVADSAKQGLNQNIYVNSDLGVGSHLQSGYSQMTHKQKTKQNYALPNSNSATSSLSAGDDRTFCDSGISSSSYSKDSACTSPSDLNAFNPTTSLGINEWVSKCTTLCKKDSTFDSNNQLKQSQELSLPKISRIPSISKIHEKPKRTNSIEMVDTQPASNIVQISQKPKTIGKSISQSGREVFSVSPQNNDFDSPNTSHKSNHDANALNKISQSMKHLHNTSSRLHSTPISTNSMISKRPNKIFINSTNAEFGKNEKIHFKTNDNPTNKASANTLSHNNNDTYHCNINKDLRPTRINEKIDDIQCNLPQQMYLSNKMNRPHKQVHQQLKFVNDRQQKTNPNQPAVINSECNKSRIKRDNGKSTILYDESFSKITSGQPSELTDDSCDIINSSLKSCNPGRAISTKPKELLSSLITSDESVGGQKKPADIRAVESTVETRKSEASLLSKSLPGTVTENPYDKPADFTNDPELLLSSLSKLGCNPCLEDNSWDQNYFSDVESEYAALELVLPIPKRESLTEAEIALELDKKLSESIQNKSADSFVNNIIPNNSLGDSTISTGKCLEPGYFSDTEAIFSSQRKFKPLSDTNTCKLPIASVAPIMSTQPTPLRNLLGENQNSLFTPKNINLKNLELPSISQCTSKINGMMQIPETKWPRLCSLQNLVHNENKIRTNHCSNHQSGINKTSRPVTNGTVGTGPLSQVKLPYPTVSMMANVGSLNDITHEGHQKGINNAYSDSDQCKRNRKLHNGGLNDVALAFNSPSMKSTDLIIEDFRQETKRLQDDIAVLLGHLFMKDNKIETLEETMESMVVRIEQLQALDNFKNSEIHELQSIIDQLRSDDMNGKSVASSPNHFQPRPPRSTSCRTLPDGIYLALSINHLLNKNYETMLRLLKLNLFEEHNQFQRKLCDR
ncbi:unnamed protein product [Schistosoma turkestanicum]|nr:unnamed protein product [Schistosoma turkestanicum]